MKKENLIVILLLFQVNLLFPQYDMDDIKSFSRAAGYLYEETVINNQKTSKTGSCFFVYSDFDAYLVTAEHVAKNCTLDTKITYSLDDYSPITYKLSEIVSDKTKLNWSIHPNADVAVILLDSEKSQIKMPVYPIEFIKSNLAAPKREKEVTVFGFPLSIGVIKTFSVISKTSKPSSGLIELPRFDNGKWSFFYLLDDQSVSGFSGGPVIQLMPEIGGAKFNLDKNKDINKIVGLVHGSINDPKAGGGFSVITPSYYILETIKSAPGYSGIHTYKYSDGKIWSEVEYLNGNPNTVISNYDINGNIQEKGSLKNGNGSRFIYDEKGKLIEVKHYINGLFQFSEIK